MTLLNANDILLPNQAAGPVDYERERPSLNPSNMPLSVRPLVSKTRTSEPG